MINPKEFNMEEINDNQFREVLMNELEAKMKRTTYHGASKKTVTIRMWDIDISDEDFKKFKESDKAYELLHAKYNKKKKETVNKFKKLKEKCDYCLHDVKPYKKLIENIDEFTYCSATTELEMFEKRYMKSNGYTKAVYRARLQAFNKIEC